VTTNDPTYPQPNRMRASDTEREEVAKLLRNAMTEGRLTLEEGEERLAAVYAARFRDELGPLTTDLPNGGRPEPAVPATRPGSGRSDLARHAALVAVLAVLLTALWAVSQTAFFWPAIPLTFLALGLARHARYRRYGYGRHGYGPWGRGPWQQTYQGGPWQETYPGGPPPQTYPGGPPPQTYRAGPWQQNHPGDPWRYRGRC
jgi:hypothetical protein